MFPHSLSELCQREQTIFTDTTLPSEFSDVPTPDVGLGLVYRGKCKGNPPGIILVVRSRNRSSTDLYLLDFGPSGSGFWVQRFVSSRTGRSVIFNEG